MMQSSKQIRRISVREIVLFSALGAMMFVSKLLMEALPNIHLVGMLTILYTAVFRKKALYPIYLFVLLQGIYQGFSVWWIPYLYIWTLLWGAVMLLPKRMKPKTQCVVYPVLCALHGLLFGTLYAPAWAILMHLDFGRMIAWIVAGFSFDIVHCVGNFALGFLVFPLKKVLEKVVSRHFTDNPISK